MMHHPDEMQLQSYLDGELAEPSRARIEKHVAQCPMCSATVQGWHQVRTALRATRPSPDVFSSGGAFWAQLAGKLPESRPQVWPLVPYVPPMILGVIGTLLQTLITLVVGAYTLSGLGIIPSLSRNISAWLPELLSHRFLAGSVYAWLGWSSREVVEYTMARWESVSRAMQNGVVFAPPLVILVLLSSIVVGLYFSWAVCWSAPSRPSRKRR
jgi:hypothetical protein